MKDPEFSVSLMCMDLMNAGAELSVLNRLAHAYHVDVMDGHFTKNLALSPDFVKAVARYSTLPLDIHLMVTTPMDWLDTLAANGANTLSVHSETIGNDAFRVLDRIKSLGCRTGVVVNPATPLENVKAYLGRVDLLTLMTVDIGYSGAPFIPEVLAKIQAAADYKRDHGLDYKIQIDGSCNKKTYAAMASAGAEMFVLGSTGLFNLSEDLETAWAGLKAEYAEATGQANLERKSA